MSTVVYATNVIEHSNSIGTGNIKLEGPDAGGKPFSVVCTNGSKVYYELEGNFSEWELGVGTWLTGGYLSRDTIEASSNAGAIVDLSPGYKRITLKKPSIDSLNNNSGLGPGVTISGTPGAGKVPVALTDTTAEWGTPSFTSTGVPGWATATGYSVGQRVIHPSGRVAVCLSAHTSSTFFDAEKFEFPSDDGATVFDFTQLPDGDLNSVFPVRGKLSRRSTANVSNLRVINGALENTLEGHNFYFEAVLPNATQKIQHFWVIIDIPAGIAVSSTIILHWLTRTGSLGIQSAAHSGFTIIEGAGGTPKWLSEPYPSPSSPPAGVLVADWPLVGPTWKPSYQLTGTTTRFDMTYNTDTKVFKGWLNGTPTWEYRDPAFFNWMSCYAALQYGPGWRIREWGISPKLPQFALSVGNRGVTTQPNTFTGIGNLTTSWQKLYEFTVYYDSTGAIEVCTTPWINCPNGVEVYLELASADTTAGANELAANPFPTVLSNSWSGRAIAFRTRSGTPGTNEKVALYARANTNSPAASFENQWKGQNHGAWRWYAYSPSVLSLWG